MYQLSFVKPFLVLHFVLLIPELYLHTCISTYEQENTKIQSCNKFSGAAVASYFTQVSIFPLWIVGTLYWYPVLVPYTGTLYWYPVLVPCTGTLYWYPVLLPSTGPTIVVLMMCACRIHNCNSLSHSLTLSLSGPSLILGSVSV